MLASRILIFHVYLTCGGQLLKAVLSLVNGFCLDIRENLFNFLEVARRQHSNQALWIDALCINQKDDREKSRQVQRMGLIYGKSVKTLIWLGCDGNLGTALAWVIDNHADIPDEIPKQIVNAITKICRHPYWDRTWITQEILHSGYTIQLLHSTHSTYLYWFCDMACKMEEMSAQNVPRLTYTFPLTYYQHQVEEMSNEANYLYGPSRAPMKDLWELLRWRGQSQCADTRDRIYGLLSLIPKCKFTVDYGEDALSLFWRAGEYFKAWMNIEHVSLLRCSLGLSIEELAEEAKRWSPLHLSFMVKDAYIPGRKRKFDSTELCFRCNATIPGRTARNISLCGYDAADSQKSSFNYLHITIDRCLKVQVHSTLHSARTKQRSQHPRTFDRTMILFRQNGDWSKLKQWYDLTKMREAVEHMERDAWVFAILFPAECIVGWLGEFEELEESRDD